jgi:hypothetical protein
MRNGDCSITSECSGFATPSPKSSTILAHTRIKMMPSPKMLLRKQLSHLSLTSKEPRLNPLLELSVKSGRRGTPVLCIPGLGLLDEAAAFMIARLLYRRGIGARVEHGEALSMSRIMGRDIKGVALVCLCYVGTPSSAQIRYAVRRIRRRTSAIPTLIALLGASVEMKTSDILEQEEFFQDSLSATIEKILATASDVSEKAQPPAFSSA